MEDYCAKTCGFCEDEEEESDCVDELGSDKCGRIKRNGCKRDARRLANYVMVRKLLRLRQQHPKRPE